MLEAKITTRDGYEITAKHKEMPARTVLSFTNKEGTVTVVELMENELEELRTVLTREWLSF